MVFGWEQLVFGVIFLINILLISCCIGVVTARGLEGICDRYAAFGVGVAVTPYVLAIWMMIVSFIPFPYLMKRCVASIFPCVCLLFVLYKNRLYAVSFLQGVITAVKKYKILAALLIILWFVFAYYSIVSISGYMEYTDAGFYMAEALTFTRSLSFHDISTYADKSAFLNGSPHNFIWPAYISYGMINTSGTLGFTNDFSAFLAIRLVPFFLLTGLASMVWSICRNAFSVLWVNILFFLTPFSRIVSAYSRDFFRIIPIILFMELLYIEWNSAKKTKPIFFYVLLALVSFALPGGHPINVFTAFSIGVCWLILSFLRKHSIKNMTHCIAFILAGGILGSYNFIYAFLKTGTLGGRCSLYADYVWEGTDLYKIYKDFFYSTMYEKSAGIIQIFKEIFEQDEFYIIPVAMLISVVILLGIFFKKKSDASIFISVNFLLAIGMILLGHFFGWSGFTYDEWLSRNSRYAYHFYLLGIITVTYAITLVSKTVKQKNRKSILLCFSTIACIAVIAFKLVPCGQSFLVAKDGEKIIYENAIVPIQKVIDEAESNDKFVTITQTDYAYDLGVQAYMLTSYFGEDLFKATSQEAVRRFLKENKIQFLCFETTYLNVFYKNSNMYEILTSMDDVKEYSSNEYVVIYEVE